MLKVIYSKSYCLNTQTHRINCSMGTVKTVANRKKTRQNRLTRWHIGPMLCSMDS